MKHQPLYLGLMMLFVFSCKKDDSSPNVVAPPATKIWGTLFASRDTTMYYGDTAHYSNDYVAAGFYDSTMSQSIYGGIVSLNTNTLTYDASGSHTYAAVAGLGYPLSSFGLLNNIKWIVLGSANVPAFNYNYTDPFPVFTGTIPDSVTKAGVLSLVFNTTNTLNADSVTITLMKDPPTTSTIPILVGTYGSKSGTVFIPLSGYNNILPGSGAQYYIEVDIKASKTVTFSGKGFRFVVQRSFVFPLRIG